MSQPTDPEYWDGPKAILNSDERMMLVDEDEEPGLNDAARWKRYQRIRERLRWAIYDFGLLYDNWDELNLDKVFEEGELNMWKTMDGLEGAIATLYRGLFASEIPFDKHVEDAVWKAEAGMNNRNVDVRFGVSTSIKGGVYGNSAVDRLTPDKVDTLRVPELRYIVEALAHSDADIAELVAEGRGNQNAHHDDE